MPNRPSRLNFFLSRSPIEQAGPTYSLSRSPIEQAGPTYSLSHIQTNRRHRPVGSASPRREASPSGRAHSSSCPSGKVLPLRPPSSWLPSTPNQYIKEPTATGHRTTSTSPRCSNPIKVTQTWPPSNVPDSCFHFLSFSLRNPTSTSIQGSRYSPPVSARIRSPPPSFIISEDRPNLLILPVPLRGELKPCSSHAHISNEQRGRPPHCLVYSGPWAETDQWRTTL
jgi:hypothetical protein